jgi:3-oxocholest-4-en-26-oate---CoA ligase
MCINTGGEKVYPEEVEAVVKTHPKIADAIVVGAADDRFGQLEVVGAAPTDPLAPPTLDEIREQCRSRLAGYKLPRALVIVDHVERSPAGKPDYRWAANIADRDAFGD